MQQHPVEQGLIIIEDSYHTRQTKLWTSDQPLAKKLYLTKHNTHKRQAPTPTEGFEPTTPASKRTQNHALHRAVTGIGIWNITYVNINLSSQ